MVFGARLRSRRRLILSFLLVMLVPAMAVVWLGMRLLEQDRALEIRQLRERRESACDRIVATLQQALAAAERSLASAPEALKIEPGDDAVVVVARSDAVEVRPKGALLYYPAPAPCRREPVEMFTTGEDLEFQRQDYERAAAAFRALAASSQAEVRAGALLRLARNLRKAGKTGEALAVYAALEREDGACVADLPASLVARRARAATIPAEVPALRQDLLAGRWRLDRGTYMQYASELGIHVAAEREALAEAADWLWRSGMPSGRRALLLAGVPLTVLWQRSGDRLAALAAGPQFSRRAWFGFDARDVRVALAGAEGRPVFGIVPAADGSAVQKSAAETGLPWTLFVSNADARADHEAFANRRRIMLAGMAMVVLLVIAGSYFILRALSREFAVAQLQSDFVSAVSHEFRTPLTALRQFTEMLNGDAEPPPEKRRAFYQAQARATERLHRLVESLLDFGRMEAGRRPYRLERVEAAALVREVADDFEREPAAAGFTLERAIGEAGIVDADPDALARALWNLLDNAVKYSGDSRAIRVSLERRNGSVAIGVQDRGLGIPRHEQGEIFGKFVRGAATRTQGIKGTGIGLAMVKHIVDAHGGAVRVESAPGEGSTFTIELPGRE